MKAKVSVVVPVYNGEKSIESCLKNLAKQTLKDIEIICVDDGSTDGSLGIIKDFMKKDGRVRVVSQKNGGLSAARNTGIKNTNTLYVMFCDCDDYFAPTMCEKMVHAMEENEVDIAACGTEVEYKAHSEIAESDTNYYRIKFSGKNYINEEITMKTDVSVCNKIFRIELIRKHGIEFPEGLNNEDYYFYNAYMSVARTIFFITQKMYKYIRHEDSIMSDTFDKSADSSDHLLIAMKLFDFYKKNEFLISHTDFFWNQFSESYWFSYEHSAKQYRKKIQLAAKSFVKENYQNYKPSSTKAKKQVYIITHNNIISKARRRVNYNCKKLYRKMNIAYRQQDYINKSIEKMEQDIYSLSDRLNSLNKE